MALTASSSIVQHKHLSATEIEKVSHFLKATSSTYATKMLETHDLEWCFVDDPKNPADKKLVQMIPCWKTKDGTLLKDKQVTITLPPVTTEYAAFKHSRIEANNVRMKRNIADSTQECNPSYLDSLVEFDEYKQVASKIMYFLNEQRAEALVKNMSKHMLFSKNQEATLQKIIKKSGEQEAIDKVIEWIFDPDNNAHFKSSLKFKKRLFADTNNDNANDRGLKSAEEFQQCESGSFTDFIKTNPDKKFRMIKMYWPNAAEVAPSEYNLINENGIIVSITFTIMRLNKSQHNGGLSVVNSLDSIHIITNGKNYNSGGGNATPPPNVFDILNNTNSSSTSFKPADISTIIEENSMDKAKDVRAAIKKRPAPELDMSPIKKK